MRRLRFIMVIAFAGAGLLAGAGNGLGQSAYVPFFIWVEETSPIRDARGDLLAGSNPGRPNWNELTGNLIQVLFVGPNGMIDLPVNRVSPSGDDTLAAAARIGGGMPYNWEESGGFCYNYGRPPQSKIYVRAFNAAEIAEASHYGDSTIFTSGQDMKVNRYGLLSTNRLLSPPLPTRTPSPTPSPSATPTPSAPPTPSPSVPPTSPPTPSITPPPTLSPTPTPTATTTATPTPSPSPTPTPLICTRLDEHFDNFQSGVRPPGWTFTNCNANSDTYTTDCNFGKGPPAIKLDATGDVAVSAAFANPDRLTFWGKSRTADPAGHLLVEEYSAVWTTVTDVYFIPAACGGYSYGPFMLDPAAIQVRFSWFGDEDDLALDDVQVSCLITPTPSPTPSPSAIPTPSATPGPITPAPTPSPQPTPSPSPMPTAYYVVGGRADFDGDRTSDVALFRPSTGEWLIRGLSSYVFGLSGDLPAVGDYDGDGVSEAAIFRPSSGLWAIRNLTRFYLGLSGDVNVPADFRGDGGLDAAIFRAGGGVWNAPGVTRFYFGRTGDAPIPEDFDGDGTVDGAIFRPMNGLWAIRGVTRFYFGRSGDYALAGDFDGDGIADAGIYRQDNGQWVVRGLTRLYCGRVFDLPVLADMDGDGSADIGIFRPASSLWAIQESGGGTSRFYYGTAGDLPIGR